MYNSVEHLRDKLPKTATIAKISTGFQFLRKPASCGLKDAPEFTYTLKAVTAGFTDVAKS
jgi:hypothetical protein